MAIKTTRIKTTQAPKTLVFDLSDQMDGRTQVFELPKAIDRHQIAYLIFNSTVYKNDVNHTFYTLSDDGTKLTTYFTYAPMGGAAHALQLIIDETAGDNEYVTRAEMEEAIQEAINNLREN